MRMAFFALFGLLTLSCGKQAEPGSNASSSRSSERQMESASLARPTSIDMVSSIEASQVAGRSSLNVKADRETPTGDTAPHESLYRVFMSIDGWTHDTPTGRSAVAGGGIMARCEYRRSDDELFIAKVVVGLLGRTALRTVEAVKKTQIDPELVQSHQVNNFTATLYRDTVTRKNWVLTAVLEESHPAVLEMTFVGLVPAQCLELAKRFDWEGIAKEVQSISMQTASPGSGLPPAL